MSVKCVDCSKYKYSNWAKSYRCYRDQMSMLSSIRKLVSNCEFYKRKWWKFWINKEAKVKAKLKVAIECPYCEHVMKQKNDTLVCDLKSCINYRKVFYKVPTVELEKCADEDEQARMRVVELMLRIAGPIWNGLSLKQISRLVDKLKMSGHFPPFTDKMIDNIKIVADIDMYGVGETECPLCEQYVEPGFMFRIKNKKGMVNTRCPKCDKETKNV